MEIVAVGLMALAAFGAIAVAIREGLRQRWLQQLSDMAATERNRNRFGVLRTKLMAMARRGEINPAGEAFAIVYGSLSQLMRNPHEYRSVVASLMKLPEPGQAGGTQGAEAITEKEGQLLLEFAQNIDLLCRDYNSWYRWAAKAYDHVVRGRPDAEIPLLVRVFAQRVRQSKKFKAEVQPIRLAKGKLTRIGNARFWPARPTGTGQHAHLA